MKEYVDKKESIDETITASLIGEMTIERLEMILKCILRAGIAEFYANPKLDAPIIINEYTDIARSFFDGPEVKMVNAILDRFGKVIKGEGKKEKGVAIFPSLCFVFYLHKIKFFCKRKRKH